MSWDGSIFLRGCYMVEREFMDAVDTVKEGGTVVS